MMGNPNVFSLLSRDHALNLRAVRGREVASSTRKCSHNNQQKNRLEVAKWIEAIDPLQAGSILSRESMRSTGGAAAVDGGGRKRSGSVIF